MAGSPQLKCTVSATLLPLLVIMTTCSGHTVRYVKPTPDTPCPADPCLTLSEYAQQPHHYLTSNTTLLLLPGDHVLSVNFTVENVSEFEINASSSPHAVKIVCQQSVGFTFRNISHMTLHGLTFTSCGRGATYMVYPAAYGVSVHSGQDTEIADCSFQDSIGTALGVFYSSLVLRGSNSFTNKLVKYSYICIGGGIYANASTLVFTGNSTFRNHSSDRGGGFYAQYSTLNFTGSSTFMNNSAADRGGGFYAWNSTLNFTGSSTFMNNSARLYGGGFYAKNSTLNFSGSLSSFTNNSAESGGGFHAGNSTLNFIGSSTFTNNSAGSGGGFYAWTITLNFIGSSTFMNNSAVICGGFFAAHYSTLNFIGSSTFTNNSAGSGGGFYAWTITLNFIGSSTFMNNSAVICGGFFAAHYSTLNFIGSSAFTNNSAGFGGGFYAGNSSNLNFTGSSTFMNNTARSTGGGFYAQYGILNFTRSSTFMFNSAEEGGGFITWSSTLNFNGSSTFTNNSADLGGGFVAVNSNLNFTGSSTFMKNSAALHGGGFYTLVSTLYFGNSTTQNTELYSGGCDSDNLVFMNNLASIHGGAVHAEDSILRFEGCNIFSGNSAHYYGGGVYSDNSTLKFNGNTTFGSNSGHLQGGGIYGLGTSLYFSGNSSFTANTAARGGGEYLTSTFNFFSPYANIVFDKNNATEYGGAVYVEDSDPISYCFPHDIKRKCSFQVNAFFNYTSIPPSLRIHLHLYNKYAQIAGSSVYGGAIFNCEVQVRNSIAKIPELIFQAFDFEMEPNNSASSDPFKVLLCKDGTPNGNTSNSELVRRVYPGELLHFPLVASGQGKETIPAVIRAFFNDTFGNTSLAQFQDTQKVKKTCTELYYQVLSSAANHNETLVLYADGPCSTNGRLLNISLQFLPCPPGFSLSSSERICGCEPRLQKYTTRCNITERAITREGEYWVGYDNSSQALILHPHCPFDYCKPVTDQTSFPLNNTDL